MRLKYVGFKIVQNLIATLMIGGVSRLSGVSFWSLMTAAVTYYLWQTFNDRLAETL